MNNALPKPVTTVQEYLKWTGDLVTPAESFAFRGQKNSEWELECGASRRLRTFDNFCPEEATNYQDKFLQYHRARLIRRARNYGFASPAGRELGDLEVLAKLQHLGAATCLLDFTRNALVALWMACESELTNGKEVNGKVFAAQLSDRKRFRELSQVDARERGNIRNILSSYDSSRSNLSWYWEPPMVEDIAPRILRQHSIFVFGHPILAEDSVYSVKIAGHAKQGILEELELQHGLSSESLFQDIFGFSSANNHISGLKIVETSVDYFRRGTQAYNQDNYETAILDFTEAVYLRPASAELFVGRAHARASLAQSRGDNLDYGTAIDDYDRAVGLVAQVPQGKEMIVHALALHNRANVQTCGC